MSSRKVNKREDADAKKEENSDDSYKINGTLTVRRKEGIPAHTSFPVINLVLDTQAKGKQAIVFVNTKPGAEKQAEEIAKAILKHPRFLKNKEQWEELANKAIGALEKPTRQCERLALCLKSGTAFHHSGLAHKQRELIEDNFRSGIIHTICCTPTLAYGVDLPAYRVIIRDLKRFEHRGMDFIPVMEYLQQAGRAGRPKYDSKGEAVIIAQTKGEAELLLEKYVNGKPEEIYSKLAVEPVLRTYVLSLVSSGLISSREGALDFFSKTFWAAQFSDTRRLEHILDKIIGLLAEWGFLYAVNPSQKVSDENRIDSVDFVSADELDARNSDLMKNSDMLRATTIGKRVSELYLDPLTAHEFITAFSKLAKPAKQDDERTHRIMTYPMLHLVSFTLEMRPLLNVRVKDHERVEQVLSSNTGYMMVGEPTAYDPDYDTYLQAAKTALFLYDWIDEKDEEFLLEEHNIRPGEMRVKLDIADWLLYCCDELLRMLGLAAYRKDISRVRTLLKYGIREELLPLVRLQQIGRVRARKLFNNGIKDIADVKRANIAVLSQLLGKEIAASVKKQVDLDPKKDIVKSNKRKGQISVGDYGDE